MGDKGDGMKRYDLDRTDPFKRSLKCWTNFFRLCLDPVKFQTFPVTFDYMS